MYFFFSFYPSFYSEIILLYYWDLFNLPIIFSILSGVLLFRFLWTLSFLNSFVCLSLALFKESIMLLSLQLLSVVLSFESCESNDALETCGRISLYFILESFLSYEFIEGSS